MCNAAVPVGSLSNEDALANEVVFPAATHSTRKGSRTPAGSGSPLVTPKAPCSAPVRGAAVEGAGGGHCHAAAVEGIASWSGPRCRGLEAWTMQLKCYVLLLLQGIDRQVWRCV